MNRPIGHSDSETTPVPPEIREAEEQYRKAHEQSLQDVLELNALKQFGPEGGDAPGEWGYIRWQVGDPAAGRNGLFLEELLEYLVSERLPFLNEVLPSRETSLVITNLEQALLWVKRRQENRVAAGVRGSMQPHGQWKSLVDYGWVPPEVPKIFQSVVARVDDPLVAGMKAGLEAFADDPTTEAGAAAAASAEPQSEFDAPGESEPEPEPEAEAGDPSINPEALSMASADAQELLGSETPEAPADDN